MITIFFNEYSFLSNFEPCLIEFEGDFYPSVEHAYQASKTIILEDRKEFKKTTLSAGKAKRLGKKLKLRDDWNYIKLDIMEYLVRYKFNNDDNLKSKLIDTFPETIQEGNTWNDTFWGVCNGIGENHLGLILMKVRKELLDDNIRDSNA